MSSEAMIFFRAFFQPWRFFETTTAAVVTVVPAPGSGSKVSN